jgi:hypothetical protein
LKVGWVLDAADVEWNCRPKSFPFHFSRLLFSVFIEQLFFWVTILFFCVPFRSEFTKFTDYFASSRGWLKSMDSPAMGAKEFSFFIRGRGPIKMERFSAVHSLLRIDLLF